jgi:ribosomal protein S18 acetylase RimI-like enzyme
MIQPENAPVARVRVTDLWAITRMVFANMSGIDQQFTDFARNPLFRLGAHLFLPFYFLTAGRGYKIAVGGEVAACAFLHLRQMSAYVFNVSVNRPYRRRGLARRLMVHLEDITRRRGLPWMALQVDEGNAPAQRLYESLGYFAYHPQFYRREEQRPLPASLENRVRVAPLISGGRSFFDRYADLERQAGDSWAARVVGQDYTSLPLPGGRFWRCSLDQVEIGAAWSAGPRDAPVTALVLAQEYWGHPLTPAIVGELIGQANAQPATIDLHLGSSAHHKAAAPVLQAASFAPQTQPRILMLKLVS